MYIYIYLKQNKYTWSLPRFSCVFSPPKKKKNGAERLAAVVASDGAGDQKGAILAVLGRCRGDGFRDLVVVHPESVSRGICPWMNMI